jgi:acetolactate synthase I/II/III large subunit
MKASDYISEFLESQGVRFVLELSGGMITHMLDSIHRRGVIQLVSIHHEQAASFAADSMGRMTGIPGVAMATSGPGATNLLTGIASCYFDSSPSVFITGQVNRNEMKRDRQIRQLGFQETDIVSMAKPITKAAWLVEDAAELPSSLERAFSIARSGRPGPVLIDIPMDVQRAEIEFPLPPLGPVATSRGGAPPSELLSLLIAAIQSASRPLILAGGGVRSAQAVDLLRRYSALIHVPVVTSLLGVDAIAYQDPLRVGMIGSYGNRWANIALGTADFVLVVGSRLDVRQTGSETGAFTQGKQIVHVDCEPGEINNRVKDCVAIHAELPDFLTAAIESAREIEWPARTAWAQHLHRLRMEWPDTNELANTPGINPNVLMHRLSDAFPHASAYVVDVGQHQMWAAQSLELGPDQRFLTSGGMGSMGFALPASIGAVLSSPGRPVVVIAGDGGFQCNIQELQTLVRNQYSVKIVVVNNGCHGMVRQFQQAYFEGRYQSTLWGYSAPDFEHVARAYGLKAATVSEAACVADAAAWLADTGDGPALLQVLVDTYTNALPKIAFGHPITEMEPFVTPLGQEST